MKTDASGFPENVRRPGIPNPIMILSDRSSLVGKEFEIREFKIPLVN